MEKLKYKDLSRDSLVAELELVKQRHSFYLDRPLSIDLARGIPGSEQIELSHSMDGILQRNFVTPSGVTTDNYGGLDGIVEAKQLFGDILGVGVDNMLVAGNSSLSLMYQYIDFAYFHGVIGKTSAWSRQDCVTKFLCPCPGYDRHFTICEYLGIEMLPVRMGATGPDMEAIERLLSQDRSIKGIWCVPKYSNPTGIIYSDEVVRRFASLAKIAGPNFRIMWDNAYAMHDLYEERPLASLLEEANSVGTQDSVVIFGSSSKMTLPGAAVCFMASSPENLAAFKRHLSVTTLGPDKINQLRHVLFLKDLAGIRAHMKKHAQLLRPKFATAIKKLDPLEKLGIGTFNRPEGGYFISFTCLPKLARNIVAYCSSVGLRLTPAGASYPYQNNPDDNHIRISISQGKEEQLNLALDTFVNCVKLASLNQMLNLEQSVVV